MHAIPLSIYLVQIGEDRNIPADVLVHAQKAAEHQRKRGQIFPEIAKALVQPLSLALLLLDGADSERA